MFRTNSILKSIDEQIVSTPPQNIPQLFKEIPFEIFGELSLQEQDEYMNIKLFFPLMADKDIQVNWTGNHGKALLAQSISFVKTVTDFSKVFFRIDDLSKFSLLDYGCGWGRLIRLFYKYIPTNQIYGIDAWDESLKICYDCKLKANLAKVDDICISIPFDTKFNIIYAFSVFTHLSKKAGNAALNAIRKSIKDEGLLILTVRPIEYWKLSTDKISADEMIKLHMNEGFAFTPHNRAPIDGDITFGDTSISINYIKKHWVDWDFIDYKINTIDPLQVIVFLRPR